MRRLACTSATAPSAASSSPGTRRWSARCPRTERERVPRRACGSGSAKRSPASAGRGVRVSRFVGTGNQHRQLAGLRLRARACRGPASSDADGARATGVLLDRRILPVHGVDAARQRAFRSRGLSSRPAQDAGETRTAQNLYSGIFPAGSSSSMVSRFAAASLK